MVNRFGSYFYGSILGVFLLAFAGWLYWREEQKRAAGDPVGLWAYAGGYAAGYYSYKWAEVLSADAYAAFEEAAQKNGHSTLDVETGRRYREAILEAGGSRPAMASFKAFRGREPGIDALLRHQGMA